MFFVRSDKHPFNTGPWTCWQLRTLAKSLSLSLSHAETLERQWVDLQEPREKHLKISKALQDKLVTFPKSLSGNVVSNSVAFLRR